MLENLSIPAVFANLRIAFPDLKSCMLSHGTGQFSTDALGYMSSMIVFKLGTESVLGSNVTLDNSLYLDKDANFRSVM